MKTLLFVLAATATTALAQQPVTMIEYGPQALQMHRQSNADIQAALNQLLEKSEAQLDSLNTLVQRQGDYLAANRDSVTRAQDAILSGYRDQAAGRVLVSSGDFKTDMEALDRKQADGWQ